MTEIPELLGSGLLLLLLFFVGYIGSKMRIPTIIVFILLGIVLGGWLTDNHLLHFAGEIGIVLLFFMLGMEFPIKQLMTVAKKVLGAGILDFFLSFAVTVLIVFTLGMDLLSAFIVGAVVYATSSSITAKLLENSKKIERPESSFMLGLLIFEDLLAPLLVAVLVGLTTGQALTVSSIILLLVKVILLVAGAIVLARGIFVKLGDLFRQKLNGDGMILFVTGLALAYGGLALYLNLSEVLGAFLAGIMLAEVRRTHELEQMVIRSRDLLMPLFFLYFGTTIDLSEGIPMIGLLLTVLMWSIVAKVIVGVIGGKWYGLSKLVALRAGLSLTQRGEFSIIVASLATTSLKAFSSMFILASTFIGIILFQYAPIISKKVYGKESAKDRMEVTH
ncbi:cation:proton antiporter [Alkalihalobacillus trypoxylicola]|uniref:Sodium:proton exchanger n=1 Tax=Alkalihalobacillus trypoxylicola TaxID=519424 RepID=A0A162F2W0_9BACI|nr:cation:proton antiporter [Alkalihalobacillus trypoxylicola]KYG34368.1 sodium:proton exchanger [Alkalihalobacillus trypoxylicola]